VDDEKLEQFKKQFGDLYEAEIGERKFYFKKPNRQNFKRYYDKLLDSVYDAAYVLCLDLAVDPSAEELAQYIESYPDFPIKMVGGITNFFGSGMIVLKKI
jgi:hypothetical protein